MKEKEIDKWLDEWLNELGANKKITKHKTKNTDSEKEESNLFVRIGVMTIVVLALVGAVIYFLYHKSDEEFVYTDVNGDIISPRRITSSDRIIDV